jgi:hypothetical protein
MPLLQILVVLIVVGVLLWLVNSYIPMQGTIKSILNAVVIIGAVLCCGSWTSSVYFIRFRTCISGLRDAG